MSGALHTVKETTVTDKKNHTPQDGKPKQKFVRLPSRRPEFIVSNSDRDMILAANALFSKMTDVFVRAADKELLYVNEDGVILDMSADSVIAMLSLRAEILTYKPETKDTEEGFKPCRLPKSVANVLIASPERGQIRVLTGVRSNPFFDGLRVITQTGYDPETGVLLNHDLGDVDIPEKPTRSQIQWAADQYRNHLDFYEFADEVSLTNAVGAHLLGLGRGLWEGPTPAVMAAGDQPGCGKTELCNSIYWIASGRKPSPSTWLGETEFGKVVGAKLRQNPLGIIYLDNLRTQLKSSKLESLITSRTADSRELGKSFSADIEHRLFVLLSANGPGLSPDLARRCVPVRLTRNPNLKPPEPLGQRAQRCRASLVRAGLVLLKAGAQSKAGEQSILQSFEESTAIVGRALSQGGFDGFLDNTDTFREDCVSSNELPDAVEKALLEIEEAPECRYARPKDIVEMAYEDNMRRLGSDGGIKPTDRKLRAEVQEFLDTREGWARVTGRHEFVFGRQVKPRGKGTWYRITEYISK